MDGQFQPLRATFRMDIQLPVYQSEKWPDQLGGVSGVSRDSVCLAGEEAEFGDESDSGSKDKCASRPSAGAGDALSGCFDDEDQDEEASHQKNAIHDEDAGANG